MAQAATVQEQHGHIADTNTGISNRKLLMWVFLASDCLFFGSFIATYLVYRNESIVGPYPNEVLDIPITSVSTFVLLMSSLAMVLALNYAQKDQLGLTRFWILAVAVLGAIFLGFQVFEFATFVNEGLTIRSNLFGTTFFILTGFHGLHVLIGVLWLLGTAFAHFKGALTSRSVEDLEMAGLYWHFVDIVWIIIFTVIYLIGFSDGEGLETIEHAATIIGG
ncbi:MAG: cytochrome c oxidase subunit 3 [Dehalococcoidia bacterium]|nr:cytochrome c oxidase subunit 3 [Dehalococcoidia bacterium]